MAGIDTTLTLIGGPTVLIELAGFRLLTDPTFDAPGQYQAGSVTLTKEQGPALAPEDVGPIDAVLLSHDQHVDNLDRAGRAFLPQATATFTTPAGAERIDGAPRALGLAPWQTARLEAIDGRRLYVTATPARHGPPGIEPISGEVTGFLIGVDRPGDSIYVSGDTVWYEGVAEVARRYQPQLVILFAGSAKPRGPFHMTMDNNDAIEVANAFPDARIATVHNEGWGHFTEGPEDVARAFGTLGLTERLERLEVGKSVRLEAQPA